MNLDTVVVDLTRPSLVMNPLALRMGVIIISKSVPNPLQKCALVASLGVLSLTMNI